MSMLSLGRMGDRPMWISSLMRLSDRGVVLKQFKRRGSRQPALLDLFEQEGWPLCLEVPLGRGPGEWTEEQLTEAVKRLNRHQSVPGLHFWVAHGGTVVCWERCLASPQGTEAGAKNPQKPEMPS